MSRRGEARERRGGEGHEGERERARGTGRRAVAPLCVRGKATSPRHATRVSRPRRHAPDKPRVRGRCPGRPACRGAAAVRRGAAGRDRGCCVLAARRAAANGARAARGARAGARRGNSKRRGRAAKRGGGVRREGVTAGTSEGRAKDDDPPPAHRRRRPHAPVVRRGGLQLRQRRRKVQALLRGRGRAVPPPRRRALERFSLRLAGGRVGVARRGGQHRGVRACCARHRCNKGKDATR